MYTVQDIVKVVDELAPYSLAEDYDNVGLLVGDPEAPVKKIMCVLDVTHQIVREAANREVDVLISHHPVIFSGIKALRADDHQGALLQKLVKEGINVIAAHTNLDSSAGGLNDYLAEKLELLDVAPLEPAGCLYTLGVYVPEDYREKVKSALFSAGAGKLGNYDQCSFAQKGQGTFRPLKGAQPFAGQVGRMESADETKLEVMVPDYRLAKVLRALLRSHPYEEPAYQVLKNRIDGRYGMGRIGSLPGDISLQAFCGKLKEILEVPALKVAGKLEKQVHTVAVCTGSGSDLYERACAQGADVLVTAEVKHHVAVKAAEAQTAIVDAGHYETEVIMKHLLAGHLQNRLNGLQYNIDILFANAEKAPFTYV